MAEIFLARPAVAEANGRILVIKRILPHVADDPMFLNMFHSEIQVIMGFNCPHTVQLYDFGETDGQPYIAMEYIDGKNLKEVMVKFVEKNEKIPVPMTLGLIIQAASGLNYAHTFENKVTGEKLNAIHRDITPHNLILSYDGNLKVIDFGISKATSELAEKTRTGLIKGKIRYLSPEQVKGSPADERSDIFSLGLVAWELLTLKRPFNMPGDDDHSVLERIRFAEKYLIHPSKIDAEIPPEVDAVIMKALESDPEKRYATAREFHRAVRDVLMKVYPAYSYSDTSQIMKALFENEMEEERAEVHEVNQKAQELLGDKSKLSQVLQNYSKDLAKSQDFSDDDLSLPRVGRTGPTDFSLIYDIQLETLKKKAARKFHFLFLGAYILSVISVKLDQKYNLLDQLFSSIKTLQGHTSEAKSQPSEVLPSVKPPSKKQKK